MFGDRRLCSRVALFAITGVLLLVSACGKRSDSSNSTATSVAPTTTEATTTTTTTTIVVTTTTVDPEVTKAEITANWERFFLPTTSIPERIALLENGESLQQALEERSQDPLMQQASAVVKDIELTGPDQATVTYDVLLNGAVALADSQGVALLQDGVWKVSADSFCALIILGADGPIPGCS